jgi:hypothetical protein
MAEGTVLMLALDADDLRDGSGLFPAFGGYLDVEIHAVLGAAGPRVSLSAEGLESVLQDVLTELLELLVIVRGQEAVGVCAHRFLYGQADGGRLPLQFSVRGPWPCP